MINKGVYMFNGNKKTVKMERQRCLVCKLQLNKNHLSPRCNFYQKKSEHWVTAF